MCLQLKGHHIPRARMYLALRGRNDSGRCGHEACRGNINNSLLHCVVLHLATSSTPTTKFLPSGDLVVVHTEPVAPLALFTSEVFDFGLDVGNIRTSQSRGSLGKGRNILSPSHLDATLGRPETRVEGGNQPNIVSEGIHVCILSDTGWKGSSRTAPLVTRPTPSHSRPVNLIPERAFPKPVCGGTTIRVARAERIGCPSAGA